MLSARPKPIVIAFVVVLMAHLILLMIPIVFEQSKSNKKSPTLKLTLRPTESSATLPEIVEEPRVNDTDISAKPQAPDSDALLAIPQDDVEPETITPDETSDRPTFNQARVVASAVTAIEKQAIQSKPDRFSLEYWQPKPEPQYQRESLAPTLIAQNASNRSSTGVTGQSTDLVRGPNGKSACWQQRGIPGETEQWYRVPIELCGHLSAD